MGFFYWPTSAGFEARERPAGSRKATSRWEESREASLSERGA
jgi:hypothetical protein